MKERCARVFNSDTICQQVRESTIHDVDSTNAEIRMAAHRFVPGAEAWIRRMAEAEAGCASVSAGTPPSAKDEALKAVLAFYDCCFVAHYDGHKCPHDGMMRHWQHVRRLVEEALKG